MSVYFDQMFAATANAVALTQLTAGITGSAGNYSPPVNGRIIGVVIGLSGQAASSLLEGLRIDLSCTTWQPNNMRFGAFGAGLRTAPAFPMPLFWYEVDQPVLTSTPIGGQYVFNVAAVSPNLQVFGQFSTKPMPIPGMVLPMQ